MAFEAQKEKLCTQSWEELDVLHFPLIIPADFYSGHDKEDGLRNSLEFIPTTKFKWKEGFWYPLLFLL